MRKKKWYTFDEIHEESMKDSEYVKAYEALEAEFEIAKQMLNARLKNKISQKELAEKVGTGQAVISRLEGMNARPSISLLQRVARALGIKFKITIG